MKALTTTRDREETHMADPPFDTGTPRWVKVFGIIVIVVVLLFVILLFTKGSHRPGPHASFGGPGGYAPSFSVTEVHTPSGAGLGGLTPSEGGHG
jgi:hypothetical protein